MKLLLRTLMAKEMQHHYQYWSGCDGSSPRLHQRRRNEWSHKFWRGAGEGQPDLTNQEPRADILILSPWEA